MNKFAFSSKKSLKQIVIGISGIVMFSLSGCTQHPEVTSEL